MLNSYRRIVSWGPFGANQTLQGNSALGSSITGENTVGNLGVSGANGDNSLNQSVLTNSLDQFNGTNNFDWSQLQNLMNIIGGKSWGGTTTGTETQNAQTNPSLLSTIGAINGITGSLIGGGGQ